MILVYRMLCLTIGVFGIIHGLMIGHNVPLYLGIVIFTLSVLVMFLSEKKLKITRIN